MAEDKNYMPYAPAGSVITAIRKYRDRGLPDVLDNQAITRVGISKGNASRTIAALKYLGLLDEDGRHTEALMRLGKVKTEDYPGELAAIINNAYEDIFQVIDPATATSIEFSDAFRGYEPAKQRARMVTLFTGLCQEANIIEGQPTVIQGRSSPTKSNGQGNKDSKNNNSNSLPPIQNDTSSLPPPSVPPVSQQYEMLAAVFKKLPKSGKWTIADRELWLKGVQIAAQIEIEVIEEEEIINQ